MLGQRRKHNVNSWNSCSFPPPLPFVVVFGWGRSVAFDVGMGERGLKDIYFLGLNRPSSTSKPSCTTSSLPQEGFVSVRGRSLCWFLCGRGLVGPEQKSTATLGSSPTMKIVLLQAPYLTQGPQILCTRKYWDNMSSLFFSTWFSLDQHFPERVPHNISPMTCSSKNKFG